MIPAIAKTDSNKVGKLAADNFKQLCSEKHIACLYRAQMSYLKTHWKEYNICDSRAIEQILNDDWRECLQDYHSGKLEAERVLEEPSCRSFRKKGLKKTASAIFHSARTFFSFCCEEPSFTSRIDTTWGPRGLINEGADCFLNSLFQEIMWGDRAFREALCSRHPILEEYVRAYEANEPMSLNPLRELLAHLSKDDSWLRGQHDPHEAMVVLTEDWNENPHRMEIEGEKIYGTSDISKKIKDKAISIACALPVPRGKQAKSSLSFVELLQNFQKPPLSAGEDAYVTENGVDLSLKKEINRLQKPVDHLTFQITRSSKRGVKSQVQIDIPKKISLGAGYFKEKPENSVTYALTGFTLHKGSSSKSGHYVAYTSELIGNTRRYFVCNDSRVKELTEQEFLKAAQGAYLVYFQKMK